MADDLLGRKVGGYEIVELIGHGGMASVYRARQISMNRIVAVKVLPRQFVSDDTYMQRFIREVKFVAELEHRNIVPVHDYGEAEGQPYIVMRYMSGGSVDDLLRQGGALDLSQIVGIVGQIAPALDYAHSKGVLHRDLKPSNILMDGSGGAYLTDFGIARLMTDVSTLTLTTHGVVGTPSYMSPEQAQGQPLDHRSDIYSLGVMLFEMATGQRPFESDTPYGIAVLQVTAIPPSPRSLNPDLSMPVEDVILTAMSKKRDQRYDSAVSLAGALKLAADAPASALSDTQPGLPHPERLDAPGTPPPPENVVYTPPPPSSAYVIPPVAVRVRQRLTPRRSGHLWMNVAVGGLIGCGLLVILALIAAVVISGIARNAQATPTAPIPGGIASPLPATATGRTGSQAGTRLPTRTGAPSTGTPAATQLNPVGVRDTPVPLTDGTIVYFAERDNNFDIYKMNLHTRDEIRLTSAASNELYPAVSPSGTQIAYMSDTDGDYDIYLMDINGGGARRLTDNSVTDRIAAWSPDGQWIGFSSDTRGDGGHDLYEVHPDGSGLKLLYSDGQRNSQPRWSKDGRFVVFTGGSPSDGATWEIRRLDLKNGGVIDLTHNDVKDSSPAVAPDGGLIYLTEGDGHAAIARMDIDGGHSRIVYDGTGYDWGAAFSPKGDLITFTSDVSGRDEIYLINADGTNLRPVTDLGGMDAAWLPLMAAGVTRAEAAAETIRAAILSGHYLSGERLIEVEIAEALDVSQNTIRDALHRLEQEGWVVKNPRRGVYVRSFSAAAAAEVCALIAAVESLALAWAMEQADKPLRADLRGLIAAARKAANGGHRRAAFEDLLRFHDRIGAAADKPLTARLLESLYNQVRLLEALRQARAPRTPHDLDAEIDAHEALLRLIEAGDSAAACAYLREQVAAYSAAMVAAVGL